MDPRTVREVFKQLIIALIPYALVFACLLAVILSVAYIEWAR